ncbi:hypothetical protein BDF19DRAFT_422974 [Syncephalis fuscata]|nr:hypothetical protein BDF19DRAFT_422974 [Syncephalis fuscata]
MTMHSLSKALFAVLAIELAALLLFTNGFFPQKAYLPPRATPVDDVPEWPGHPISNACEVLKTKQTKSSRKYALFDACFGIAPQFDRLIFMVVDALRYDFVLGPDSYMKFTKQAIDNQHAVPFISRATAPTVTLPRIKALSTGMIPNFQDAILNIVESSESGTTNDDNWLVQLREHRDKNFIFYGDETWLNFAAPLFKRYEGTSSFFVADTVEVDTNVTRHVEPELAKSDWDVMILHYLGLDHIGHSAGPKSPLMKPKQREMDDVVRILYERTKKVDEERIKANSHALPTLIILCGDHGMNELGGHGGSSPGETSPALIFMSPSVQWSNITIPARTINQIDVVPTISLLFGVPSPRNSLGNLVPEMFQALPREQWIRALQLNANQIRSMMISLWNNWDTSCLEGHDLATVNCDADMEGENEELICNYEQAVYYHQHISNNEQADIIEQVAYLYQKFAEQGAQRLTQDFSSYGLGSMLAGMILMAITTLVSIRLFYHVVQQQQQQQNASFKSNSASLSKFKAQSLLWRHNHILSKSAVVLAILYGIGLFASSYIEEEHQMWYFIVQTIWLIQIILWWPSSDRINQRQLVIYPLFQMILMRLLRVWNQTGQKYADQLDIRFYLNSTHMDLRRLLMFISVIAVCGWGIYITLVRHRQYYLGNLRNIAITITIAITGSMVIFYKLAYEAESHLDIPAIIGHWMIDHIGKLTLARLAYFGIFTLLMMASFWPNNASQQQTRTSDRLQLYLMATTLLLILLARMHNSFVFVIFGGQLYALINYIRCLKTMFEKNSQGNPGLSTIMYTVQLGIPILVLQQVAFFALGNSNSLASFELNNAYVGITTFIPAIVGLLAFICNWTGPIWWALAGMMALGTVIELGHEKSSYLSFSLLASSTANTDKNTNTDESLTAPLLQQSLDTNNDIDAWSQSITLWLWMNKVFFSFSLLGLSIAVTVLRYHLFIWTVFSPKYLYQAAWMVFHISTSCWMMYVGRMLPTSLPKRLFSNT